MSSPPPEDPTLSPRGNCRSSPLNNVQDYVRIPALQASTNYEALVYAHQEQTMGLLECTAAFWTSIPTEVFVSNITQDHVEVKWGQRGVEGSQSAMCSNTSCGFKATMTVPTKWNWTQAAAPDQGLSVNACYSVTLRLLSTDRSGDSGPTQRSFSQKSSQWSHRGFPRLGTPVLVEQASPDHNRPRHSFYRC